MKLKQCLYLLIFCSLLLLHATSAKSVILPNSLEITLFANDEPFTMPNGREKEPRSIPMAIPFSAFLNDNHSIDLDFYQPIGEIEIEISQNEIVLCSFTENVESPVLRNVPLQQNLTGDFLLEIKGSDGAYAFGHFTIY